MGRPAKDISNTRVGLLLINNRCGSTKSGASLWQCKCDCGDIIERDAGYLSVGRNHSCGCYLKNKYDITGQIFNRLTAIRLDHITPEHREYWLCRCECGIEKSIRKDSLKDGSVQSCGCYNKKIVANNYHNLTGQTFSRLTVVSRSENRGLGDQIKWNCTCECGNKSEVATNNLVSGTTKSCGCLKIEKITDQGKKNAGKNNGMYGRIRDKHPNWKGEDHRSETDRLRKSKEYLTWRNLVFDRDNYTCKKCDQVGKKLNAHHIKSFYKYPADRFKVNNGITFCKSCHKEFHTLYGIKLNNEKQLKEFLIDKQ